MFVKLNIRSGRRFRGEWSPALWTILLGVPDVTRCESGEGSEGFSGHRVVVVVFEVVCGSVTESIGTGGMERLYVGPSGGELWTHWKWLEDQIDVLSCSLFESHPMVTGGGSDIEKLWRYVDTWWRRFCWMIKNSSVCFEICESEFRYSR